MKTYKNLYAKLCCFDNLKDAYFKAGKHKSNNPKVKKFEEEWQKNLLRLQRQLEKKTYTPKKLKTFILRDPKTRKISVSNFRDRIVHHALVNVLQTVFEPGFIFDSYASIKGKGTLKAVERVYFFLRKLSKNGKLLASNKNNNCIMGFALKADIKHYFETVDHNTLIKIIEKKIKDKDVLRLARIILRNYSSKIAGKGMPLGNWTSQFFANVYLNELDHFVKHKLKAKYYLRYVDDFVILHKSKKQLIEWKNLINKFLQKELFLELHKQKSKIQALGRGTDLLGFKCFYYFRILRKRNIRKMLKRIEEFKNSERSAGDILESFQGWNAYAMHGDSFKLRTSIAEQIGRPA